MCEFIPEIDESLRVTNEVSVTHAPIVNLEGWHSGCVTLSGDKYSFEAKVYGVGSKYGIKGGRVSKLYITDSNGNMVLQYDRGWGTRPRNDKVRTVLALILNEFGCSR